jgi:photosystem II stability/assembly factor-like uncharacterized protein
MINFKANKFKKIGILGTLFLFCATSFLNNSFFANASVSQSVLSIAKGGTNANSMESAQKNLGLTDEVTGSSTNDQFPSSKAVYNHIDLLLNPRFLAVGTGGLIATSKDGLSWKEIASPTTTELRDSAWGKGKFVIAGVGLILYSASGADWKTANLPSEIASNEIIYNLCFGDDKFVAVTSVGKILYSYDGITWQLSNIASGSLIYDVIYAGGQFVTVGDNAYGYYSQDGITWSQKGSYGFSSSRGIAYGDGKYVVCASGKIVYSADSGASWTNVTPSSSVALHDILYNNGLFVGVGAQDGIMYSSDAINWTLTYPPQKSSISRDHIIYGAGKYIGYGAVTSSIYNYIVSDDGITWQTRDSEFTDRTIRGMIYNK